MKKTIQYKGYPFLIQVIFGEPIKVQLSHTGAANFSIEKSATEADAIHVINDLIQQAESWVDQRERVSLIGQSNGELKVRLSSEGFQQI